jgi:glycerate 2-kinase
MEDPITLIAIGKAARAMARGAIDILAARIGGGVVVSTDPPGALGFPGIRQFQGGHPIPTAASLQAGRMVMAEAANASGTLLVLVSGGASAIADVPLEGLSLADVASTYQLLLRAGLPIESMNLVRRHLSVLKNGGVSRATRARTVTLLVADVVGSDAATIGSGPTLADTSTPADALAIVQGAGILEALPGPVVKALRSAGGPQLVSSPHLWAIITDGAAAVRAASDYIRQSGFRAEVDHNPLSGDAAGQGRRMAREAVPSAVTLQHGETVVRVRGESPGGRNQHAALAAAIALDSQMAVFAAFASDGRDGLTDVAGAIVDGETCHRLGALGFDPEKMLEECRSHEALAASGDLVITGPTGTNVADIWMSWRQ